MQGSSQTAGLVLVRRLTSDADILRRLSPHAALGGGGGSGRIQGRPR